MAVKLLRFFCMCLLAESAFALVLEDYVKGTWREVKTENIHLITDSSERQAKVIVRDLENFRFFLTDIARYPILEGVPPIKILAIKKPSAFKRLGLNEKVAGIYTKTSDGSFYIANVKSYKLKSHKISEGRSYLLHEYVHYFMSNTFDQLYYPWWYKEGLAEYYGSFAYDDHMTSIGEQRIMKRRLFRLFDGSGKNVNPLFLKSLFHSGEKYLGLNKQGFSRKNTPMGEIYYARSLAVIHYLYSSPDKKEMLSEYVQRINNGEEFDVAFKNAFKTTYDAMDAEIRNYLSSREIMSWEFTLDGHKIPFPELSLEVKVLKDEEVYFHMFDVLMRFFSHNLEENKELLKDLLVKYASNNDLKTLAAYYSYNLDEKNGVPLLEEVLTNDPKNSYALALMGDVVYRQAMHYRSAAHKDTVAKFKQARRFYRKAAQYNPFNGRAYRGLGHVYFNMPREKLATFESLKEAFAAYDNARFFVSETQLVSVNYRDAILRASVGNNVDASKALGYYNVAARSNWTKYYGQFIKDALELSVLMEENPALDGDYWVYSDGSKFSGQMRGGRPHGKGLLVRANGVTAEGSWENGFLVGKANFKSMNGFVYLGEFDRGKLNGAGRIDGQGKAGLNEMVGTFVNGVLHGWSEISYRDNSMEKGNYWLGSRHGLMTFIDQQGNEERHEYVYGDRRVKLESGEFFVGDVSKDGKPKGEGTCFKAGADAVPYACSF